VEENQKAWIKMIDISCTRQRFLDLIPHFVNGGVNINATLDRKYAQLIPRFFYKSDKHSCHDGLNLLHLCIRHKCLDVARALIKAGADVNARRGDGGTPLTMSSAIGLPDITRMLINTPGCLFIPDNNGWVALHWASYEGNAECVTLLVRAGANRHLPKNNQGRTPRMLARNSEVRKAFERALMTSSELQKEKKLEEELARHLAESKEKTRKQEEANEKCCNLLIFPICLPFILLGCVCELFRPCMDSPSD
jgi:hypothetical protein